MSTRQFMTSIEIFMQAFPGKTAILIKDIVLKLTERGSGSLMEYFLESKHLQCLFDPAFFPFDALTLVCETGSPTHQTLPDNFSHNPTTID